MPFFQINTFLSTELGKYNCLHEIQRCPWTFLMSGLLTTNRTSCELVGPHKNAFLSLPAGQKMQHNFIHLTWSLHGVYTVQCNFNGLFANTNCRVRILLGSFCLQGYLPLCLWISGASIRQKYKGKSHGGISHKSIDSVTKGGLPPLRELVIAWEYWADAPLVTAWGCRADPL